MTLTKNAKLWSLLLVGVIVGAIMLLAAGFTNFELLPGEPFPYRLLFGDSQSATAAENIPLGLSTAFIEILVMLGILFLMLLIVLWIITFILRPQARKRMLQRIITYFVLLLLMYAFLEGFRRMAATGQPEASDPAAATLPEEVPPVEDLPVPPIFVIDPPLWLITAVTLTIISLFLGLAWFLWQRRSALHLHQRGQEESISRLAQEAQQALEQLQRGYDAKNSVLGCYRAMSQLLKEERGLERQKTMTARDFEYHLTEIGLDDEHIQRLTRLFEKFRYGAGAPGQQDEAEAIACLSAIAQAYGKSS